MVKFKKDFSPEGVRFSYLKLIYDQLPGKFHLILENDQINGVLLECATSVQINESCLKQKPTYFSRQTLPELQKYFLWIPCMFKTLMCNTLYCSVKRK